jgi:plexin A
MNISNVPGVDYTCVYQFDDTSITTTSSATLDGNATVTCPLPHNSELPPIVDGIIYATISLKTTSDVFIVSLTDQQKIAITNCTMKTSCLSCLNLAQACNWCPFDNKCVSPLQNCANPLGGTGAEMCPLIQPPDRADTSDYLLHASIPQSLMIRAINIGIFDTSLFNISCIIKHTNGTSIYRLNGLWNETSSVIVCSEDMFNVTLNSTHLFESLLNVEITNANSAISIENFMNSKVVFYSCPLMGENCGQCLSIESKFQCGYCLASQACIQSTLISCDSPNILEEITDITMCETPIIYTFSPTAGPVSGETIVEINGRNLAANVSQIMSISILTETCTHLPNMYIPGKRVVCKTQKTNTGIVEAKIVIEFTYDQSVSSAESYRFLIVSLDNPAANPAIGPVSGGTIVTLSGSHLGIGNHRSISLAGQDCEILNPENIMVNDTNITCITQSSTTTTDVGNGVILLIVDNNPLYRTGFDYLSDPEFTGIRPQNFFNSGGTDFTIEGKNFHTITNPRMLFYISFDASETIITKNMSCEHSSSDNNVITCKAPSLEFNATQIRSATVEFGFQMDNVTQMRLIHNHTLNIYDDPTFDKGIEEQLEPGNEKNITIMGNGFYFSDVQVVVTVGSLNCKIQNLTDKALTCLLEVPITQENGNYPITVQVGSRSWEVGTLEIRRPLEIYVYLAPIIAAIFVVFIVFFIIILSVFYRKYKQKDEQNDRLILELEKLEYNVAHECKLGN